MRQISTILSSVVTLFVLAFSQLAVAQTGNTCGQAISVPVNVNMCTLSTVSNVGLTASGIAPSGCPGYAGGDLWLSVVMPPSGELTFRAQLNLTTPTFSMDINLAVYSGTCGSLTQIGCDTDSGPGFYPQITFSGTPGVTYFIQLWDIGNNQQDQIDVCANGTPTCSSPTVSTGRVCGATNQFSVNVTISNLGSAPALNILNNGGAPAINNVTATGTYSVGPFSLGQQVAITVENPNDNTCNVVRNVNDVGLGCNRVIACGNDLNQTYCYGNNDNSVFLYSSSNGSPITLEFITGLIQNGADIITIRNGATGTSPILFQGSNAGNLAGIVRTASSGTIRLNVTSNIAGSCSDNSLGLGGGWNWSVACEGNAACDGAITVVSQTTLAASIISADVADVAFSGDPQCAGPGSNPDPFFRFIAVGSTTFISARGIGDFDAVIEVFDECDGIQLACSNTAGDGGEELVTLTNLIPGEEYLYRVHDAGATTPATTSFVTGVTHLPIVQLRTDFCGIVDVTPNTIIRSTTAAPSTNLVGYVFEFTELEAPITTYEVVSPNGTNPQFRMQWFTNFEYGRSYTVRTKALFSPGAVSGDYGPGCVITYVDEPISGLQPQFVGGTFSLCSVLRAISYAGSTNYRWTFDSGSDILEFNSNSGNYFCSLQNVDGLQYGTSYTVRVFVTGGGIESETSTESVINMLPTAPTTSLNPAFIACGSTVTLTAGTQAFNVCDASQYEFRFTNLTTTEEDVFAVRANRSIVFSTVPGLNAGNTYNVAVRATAGGSTADFGSECAISIAATAPGIVAEIASTESAQPLNDGPTSTIYPNPNAGNNLQVLISQLDGVQQQIQIEIYDLTGKMVNQENFGTNNTSFRTSLPIQGNLAQGVYIVSTRINGVVISTEKLFVK